MYFAGVDLAWAGRNPTGIAVVDDDGVLVSVGAVRTDDDVLDALRPWVTVPLCWAVVAPLGEPELVPFCDPMVAPLFVPWLGVPGPLFGACWPELVVAPADGWLPGVEVAPPEELEPVWASAMATAKSNTVKVAISPFTVFSCETGM